VGTAWRRDFFLLILKMLRVFEDFVELSARIEEMFTTKMGIVRLTGGRCNQLVHAAYFTDAQPRLSYHRHRFPAEIISYCVWLYFRFALSFRDVEEMLAMRGVSLSYETVREWCLTSDRLLSLEDGSMLEALKRLDNKIIHLPGRLKDRPDPDRLALRFERFKAVA
jgi:hypothetical protein